MKLALWILLAPFFTWLSGCTCGDPTPIDAGARDAGDARDAGQGDGGTGDAGGIDAGVDAGASDAGPLACRYGCRRPVRLGTPSEATLTALPFEANVHVAEPLRIGRRNFFSFIADSCCRTTGGVTDESTSGLAVVTPSGALTQTLVSGQPVAGVGALSTPFERAGQPVFLHPNGDWATATPVDPDTLTPAAALDITGLSLSDPPFSAPSIVTLDDGTMLVLQGTMMRLTHVDASFAPMAAPIDLMLEARFGVLIPTCDGIVALFAQQGGALLSLELAADGTPTAATPTMISDAAGPAPLDVHAIWDGEAITVAGDDRVLELDAHGAVLRETVLANVPIAAVGTEDGLVVVENEADVARIVLRERETGRLLATLGRLPQLADAFDAAFGVGDGSLDVVLTSFNTRSRLTVASIACE
ncbi:MAG: hypothetical protein AB7S26_25635 [Sandaracinaceae bacterium]